MIRKDIEKNVNEYVEMRDANHRYTSFDYCYNYFMNTQDLKVDIEKSCLVLGFYLASWGMYRGSSFLLQNSLKVLEPTIKYIIEKKESESDLWKIDVDKYNDVNIERIIKIYNGIKEKLIDNKDEKHRPITLVTKILLGVFGFIPAYDENFCSTFRDMDKTCGFRRFDDRSLTIISDFYNENKDIINKLSDNIKTIDFKTGKESDIHYPKAKIIDMYGFKKGMRK